MICKNFKCSNEIDFTTRRADALFCSNRCYKAFQNYKYKNKKGKVTSSKVGNGNVIPLYNTKGEGIKKKRTQKDIFGNDIVVNEVTGKPKIEPQPVTLQKKDFEKIKFSKKFDFLKVEKKAKGSVFMSLDAPAGAGKTTLLFQIIGDAAKMGNKVLFISLEELPTSALFIEKGDKFWNKKSINNIKTLDHVTDRNELINLCNNYDVIAIDSFGKLPKGIEVEHFRKNVDGAFIIAIFQQTNEGKTRGGSVVGFDADLVGKMKVEGEGADKESWLYFDKMRYYGERQGELLYNAFGKSEVREIEEDELIPPITPPPTPPITPPPTPPITPPPTLPAPPAPLTTQPTYYGKKYSYINGGDIFNPFGYDIFNPFKETKNKTKKRVEKKNSVQHYNQEFYRPTKNNSHSQILPPWLERTIAFSVTGFFAWHLLKSFK